MNTETNDRLNFLVIIWKKLFLMTMHATSPFTNFKEIEGSIFIMKTFSVLTQTMAEVFRGQEGQSSIKRRVTVALLSNSRVTEFLFRERKLNPRIPRTESMVVCK